jgi:hypothetical protein
MSTLKADTIQSTSGGAATLTSQAAAKVLFCMNLGGSTLMNVATNAISTQTLNVSSGTDAGTGLARANLTNAMNALDYIWSEGAQAANHTFNLSTGVATTSLVPFEVHAADAGADDDRLGCGTVNGDLA